eukprot:UN01921
MYDGGRDIVVSCCCFCFDKRRRRDNETKKPHAFCCFLLLLRLSCYDEKRHNLPQKRVVYEEITVHSKIFFVFFFPGLGFKKLKKIIITIFLFFCEKEKSLKNVYISSNLH